MHMHMPFINSSSMLLPYTFTRSLTMTAGIAALFPQAHQHITLLRRKKVVAAIAASLSESPRPSTVGAGSVFCSQTSRPCFWFLWSSPRVRGARPEVRVLARAAPRRHLPRPPWTCSVPVVDAERPPAPQPCGWRSAGSAQAQCTRGTASNSYAMMPRCAAASAAGRPCHVVPQVATVKLAFNIG